MCEHLSQVLLYVQSEEHKAEKLSHKDQAATLTAIV